MALKLQSTLKRGVHFVEIYFDGVNNLWITKAYPLGRHSVSTDKTTTTKKEAEKSAKYWLKHYAMLHVVDTYNDRKG